MPIGIEFLVNEFKKQRWEKSDVCWSSFCNRLNESLHLTRFVNSSLAPDGEMLAVVEHKVVVAFSELAFGSFDGLFGGLDGDFVAEKGVDSEFEKSSEVKQFGIFDIIAVSFKVDDKNIRRAVFEL